MNKKDYSAVDNETLKTQILQKLMAHEAIAEITGIFSSVISSVNDYDSNSSKSLEKSFTTEQKNLFSQYKKPINENYSNEKLMKMWQLDSNVVLATANREQLLNTIHLLDEAIDYSNKVTTLLVAVNQKIKKNEIVQSNYMRSELEPEEVIPAVVKSKNKPSF